MLTLNAVDLCVAYDKHLVIGELSVTVTPNKITSLIGPNGSGKSTLLKALSRILKPSRGVVYLDQTNLQNMKTKHVAQQLSVLPQIHDAPEGLTVRELVRFGRYAHNSFFNFVSYAEDSIIDEALEYIGIRELADRYCSELSGGQRQLVWIAMSMAQEAEIMLLDEPTTFLDIAHQLEVLMLIQRLRDQRRKTFVLVLHDINQAARFSDHLIVLNNGSIKAEGSPADVLTVEMLSEVFSIESIIRKNEIWGTVECMPIRHRPI